MGFVYSCVSSFCGTGPKSGFISVKLVAFLPLLPCEWSLHAYIQQPNTVRQTIMALLQQKEQTQEIFHWFSEVFLPSI